MARFVLIENWKSSYKWFSMQGMGFVTAGLGAYALLPDKLQDALPPKVVAGLAVGILLLSMLSRLIHQPAKKKRKKPKNKKVQISANVSKDSK